MPTDDLATFARTTTDLDVLRRRMKFGAPEERKTLARHIPSDRLTPEIVDVALEHSVCLVPLADRDDLPPHIADRVAQAAVEAIGWTGTVRSGQRALELLVKGDHRLPLSVLAEVVRRAGRSAPDPNAGAATRVVDRHTGAKELARSAQAVLEARTLVREGGGAVTADRSTRFRRLSPIQAGPEVSRKLLRRSAPSGPKERRTFLREILETDPAWGVALLEEAPGLVSEIDPEDLVPALTADHQSVRSRAILMSVRAGKARGHDRRTEAEGPARS